MPGGLFGPSQTGTQTKTETNPLAQAQGNLLQGAWGGPGFERPGTAVDLATNNPITAYPGQTYANPTEQQYTGLNNLFNAGAFAQGPLFNNALNTFMQGTGGQFGYAQSPSYNSLLPYAGGSAAPQQFALSNASTVLDMANRSAAVAPDLYSRLIGYGNQAAGAGSAYAPQIAGTGSQYGTGLRDLSGQSANAGAGYAGNLQGAGAQSSALGQQYGTGLDLVGQNAANLGIGYGNQLAGAAGGALGSAQGYGNQLSGAAQGAAGSAGQYADMLTAAGVGAGGSADQYARMLAGTGYQAGGAGAQASRQLNQLAGQIPGMTGPAANLLGYNAATAVGGNPATAYLQQEASGGNFGNPYLSSLYDSAARGVTGQFQTGTSPKLASQAAAAGRYGSGILANQEKQAYDQFGTNLTDLAAKLYTPAYAQDRSQQLQAAQSLGTQYGTNLGIGTQAAQALGNLGLGSADAIRNALTGASQQRLQGLQQQGAAQGAAATAAGQGQGQLLTGLSNAATTAGQGQGQLLSGLANAATATGQGFGQYLSGLGTAAQEANRGLATQAGALGAGGQLGLQGAGQNVTAQANAANAGLQGLQQAGTQLQAGGALDINSLIAANQAQQSGLQNAISAAQAGGNQYLTGLGNAGTLANNAGTLNLGVGNQQLQGLRDLQGAYQSGIGNQFTAANMAPGLANLDATGAQRQLDVGTQYQTLNQAQLADAQKRFNDQQMAPRQNLDTLIKELSGNFGPNTTSSAPIYGSPLAQGLGALGSVNSLLGSGGLNVGGLGGLAGSLGSGLGLTGAGSVLSGIGSGALPAVLAPEIGGAGLTALAGMNAGTGIGSALAAAAPAAGFTIICTELVKQGKMPDVWRKAGMRQFMRYPELARRGYWVWATPVVQHLRKKPDSRFSRLIEKTFNWRAEDLAARNGIKGARRLLRGRIVTAAMVLPCLACGLVARRGYAPTLKDAPV